MGMITGSGFKPTALQVYVPKSVALGVMGKMVFPVFCSVPSGHFQVTSGGGNPRTGQQIVVGTPFLAVWFVLGHTSKCLFKAKSQKEKKYRYLVKIISLFFLHMCDRTGPNSLLYSGSPHMSNTPNLSPIVLTRRRIESDRHRNRK